MSAQLNIFLLLFGGLQGLLLAILLVRKRAYRGAYVFLIAYILVMILQILFKVVSKSWLIDNVDFLYFTSYQLPFLYGPLIYLLTVQLHRPGRKFSFVDAMHFLPFALTATATILNFGYREHGLPTMMLTNVKITLWFHLVSIIGYHYLAFREQSKMRLEPIAPTMRAEVLWLRSFILASVVVSLVIAFGIFFLYASFPKMSELRWTFGALTLFIYWISYKALSQPEIFGVIRGGAGGGPALQADLRLIVGREKRRYGSSGLNTDESTRIRASLENLMTVRKVYLDPDVSMDQLAEMISCSRHHLSQVMNEKEGMSFYEYVNHFRINESRQQLADLGRHHKIATIAYASGFNSLSVFNEVFKRSVGMTPSEYRRQAIHGHRKQV